MTNPPFNRRKTDQTPWWIRGIILSVGAVLAGLIVTVLVFTNTVKGYESQNRENAIAACERGNDARVSTIKNFRADVDALTSDIDLLRTFRAVIPTSTLETFIDSKRATIVTKETTIATQISAVSEFAVKPGSAVVDCERAYPK